MTAVLVYIACKHLPVGTVYAVFTGMGALGSVAAGIAFYGEPADAALVGRLAMAHEGRWPSTDEDALPSKIGECVWWLAVIAEHTGIDFEESVASFLDGKLASLS